MRVVKSVPMTADKKAQTATKVARKSVPTAAAGKQVQVQQNKILIMNQACAPPSTF